MDAGENRNAKEPGNNASDPDSNPVEDRPTHIYRLVNSPQALFVIVIEAPQAFFQFAKPVFSG